MSLLFTGETSLKAATPTTTKKKKKNEGGGRKKKGSFSFFGAGLYNYSFAVCVFFLIFLIRRGRNYRSQPRGSLLLSAGLISQRMNGNCQSDAALSSETRGD